MAEVMSLVDFRPAPKLDVFGKLDPAKATESEPRGQEVFSGKSRCAQCHPSPYYTDNLMHDMRTEWIFNLVTSVKLTEQAKADLAAFLRCL